MEKVDNLNILFYVNSYAFLWGWKFLLMSTMTTYFHNFSRTNEITFHKFMVQISPFPNSPIGPMENWNFLLMSFGLVLYLCEGQDNSFF